MTPTVLAADSGEPFVGNSRVAATNGLESFGTFADGQGMYTLSLPSGSFTVTAEPDYPFFFQCPAAANTVSFVPNANNNATLDLPIQSLDVIHEIKGKVNLDQNDNCLADLGEPALNQSNLQLYVGSHFINLFTNNDGEYQVFVPSGDYSLHLSTLNSNFGVCGQAYRQVSITGTTPQTHTEDFVVFPEIDCALMQVSVGGSQVRPCTTEVIQFFYRNGGTITADNASLEVMLDPALEYLSASPAPASVLGNTLQFDLDAVEPNYNDHYQTVKISVLPNCNLVIGQQVCVSAQISPDVPCQQSPAWNGAIITVDGECSNTSDSVIFRIRNIGNGPNLNIQDFIIDEDQIVLFQGTFQLPAGGVQEQTVLPMSNSSTVSITAEQEPGAPGDTLVTYSLTNCIGIGGGAPSGLGGNSGQFSDYQCLAVVNSYDPNEKTASPIGSGNQHLVRKGTPLEYTIHFQNTGNDTAFLVVLRDTLSNKMDYSRIELLGSSHPYELAQINDSILHIRFDNILLPDSLTNPEGSQGFFSFKIYPKSGLSDGTVVNNHAAIYFDQNPPIITNTVSRTYGEYYLVSTDEQKGPAQVRVSVSPNPFMEAATFELPGELPNHERQLEVFDASGRILKTLSFSEKTCQLRREDLASGMHFWRITEGGKVLASGKIVAGN